MRLVILAAAISTLFSAEPKVQNARMETRRADSGIAAAVGVIVASQTAPAWIAYSVPMIPGERSLCCWNSNNPGYGCGLEPQTVQPSFPPATGTVHLEGAPEFFVFLRVENRVIEKTRTFSMECAIDGGGLPLYWVTGAAPSGSVALLESLLVEDGNRGKKSMSHSAIGAIALHRDPSADAALDRLTSADHSEETRRQAAFWLGNSRGRHGYDSLIRILREDPSAKVREHAVFALTLSKEREAGSAIARVARDDKSAQVRGQALFWLAKKGPPEIAAAEIKTALEQDPDQSVKKKAVFALTQMPDGGVPALMELARKSKNETLRKESITWLGRSKDPRAMKFFEEMLAVR